MPRGASTLWLPLIAAALAGCASFPSPDPGGASMPDTSGKPYHPTAFVDVRYFHGAPGDARARLDPANTAMARAAVDRALQAASPFDRYSFDALAHDRFDQVVQLYFYDEASWMSALSGFLSGITLGLVPGAATDRFTLLASATSVDRPRAAPQRSENSMTTWMGVWFLPLSGRTPERAAAAVLEGLARDGVRRLIESNQIAFTPPSNVGPHAAQVITPIEPAPLAPTEPPTPR